MFFPINVLPSNFVPYGSIIDLKIRPLKLKEVKILSQYGEGRLSYEVLFNLLANKVIKATDFPLEELTLHDFDFLCLAICSNTFSELSFNISVTCPKCSLKKEKIKIGNVEVDASKIMRTITPQELLFEEIDPNKVIPPIIVEFSFGRRQVDFIRLKHILETKESDYLEYALMSRLVENLTEEEYDNMTPEDEVTLTYLYDEVLYHGAKYQTEIECKRCGTKIPVDLDWGSLQFFPFRPDRDSIESRICFGSDSTSTDNSASKHAFYRDTKPIKRIRKVS